MSFSALYTGSLFSNSWHVPVVFPALCIRCIFPYLVPVARFPRFTPASVVIFPRLVSVTLFDLSLDWLILSPARAVNSDMITSVLIGLCPSADAY